MKFHRIIENMIKDIFKDDIKYSEEILFDDSEGTLNSFELNKSIEEFEYIEVFSNIGYSKIHVSTNKRCFISNSIRGDDKIIYNHCIQIDFNKNKAIISSNYNYYNSTILSDYNKVYRVVGYKKL